MALKANTVREKKVDMLGLMSTLEEQIVCTAAKVRIPDVQFQFSVGVLHFVPFCYSVDIFQFEPKLTERI